MSDDNKASFAGIDLGSLTNAVGDALGSQEDIGKVISFVRDHGDDLVALVKRLPELMGATATALTEAADDVGGAAKFLTGGEGAGPGVKALSELASNALDTCRDELGSAKGMLDAVAGAFSKLPIPDGGIGDRLTEAAGRFEMVGTKLAEVAEQLRGMGQAVDQAGGGLSATSDKLRAGGTELGKFTS